MSSELPGTFHQLVGEEGLRTFSITLYIVYYVLQLGRVLNGPLTVEPSRH